MKRLAWPVGMVSLVAVLALAAWHLGRAEERPRVVGSQSDERIPWTTSRIVGTPEPPPPYTIEPAFPDLTFQQPVLLTALPGTDSLVVAELRGKVLSFPNDPATDSADLMIDLKSKWPALDNIYGLAFHPEYEQNRYVFICYTVGSNLPEGTRVSRFQVQPGTPPTIDPDSEEILLTWLSGGHNGGCLVFGPKDGYLYISTGDGGPASPPDPLLAGQDMTSFLSKILRIDVDQTDPGKAYRVPPDNPFVDLEDVRPEIWSYGFRNPWRMSIDSKSGDLWVGDVGWELWELVYRVEPGGNYGWSVTEGRQPVLPDQPRGPTPILPPLVDHPHSEAASITGGYVYHGTRLPEIEGTYIYGDFQTGILWGLRADGHAVTWHEVIAETPLQLVSFGEDHAGELYLVDYEWTGQIYQLVPDPTPQRDHPPFPTRLSESGLFASTKDLEPAPGVLPYSINTPLWADGTTAERLLAVPNAERIEWKPEGLWGFPDGSVLARTVFLETTPGDPTTRQRLETQILHLEDGAWRSYTYLWNDTQTDATLAPAEGMDRVLQVADPSRPNGVRDQTYRVAARSECVLCHNPWAGEGLEFGRQSASPLSANTLQMLDDQAAQLRTFETLGLFQAPLPDNVTELARLVDPYDDSADLNARARSYLHTNCAQCHRFNGGGSTNLILSFDRTLDETRALDPPSQGDFGLPEARIIAPGDPTRSVLFFRMAKLGGGRMPRLGSKEVDEEAVAFFERWITKLPSDSAPIELPNEDLAGLDALKNDIEPGEQAEAIDRLLDSTRGALALLCELDRGALPGLALDTLAQTAKGHANPDARDLFERFLPASERIERLGDVIDPDAILSLPGDPNRGRDVFFTNSAAQCRTCHVVHGEGQPLGPDLSEIGAKYSKEEMLEHILFPSKLVEPEYVNYLLETTAGQVYSGLIVERTEEQLTLRDAQDESVEIQVSEVEQLVPQAQSLMPELLLRDLTAQEAADLIEFLSTLKLE